MAHSNLRRWIGLGVGATVLTSVTFALSTRTLAETAKASGADTRAGVQDLAPAPDEAQFGGGGGVGGGEGGGFPGGPGAQGGFPGGPGPGFGRPMMGGFGGPATMTATPTAVFVLRGNTLYSFEARTLRLTAQAELPMPAGGGGFGPGGGGGLNGGPGQGGGGALGGGGGRDRGPRPGGDRGAPRPEGAPQ